jgi:hypothetical protein
LPDGFKIVDKEDLPEAPLEPKIPHPMTMTQRLMMSATPPGLGSLFHDMDLLAQHPVYLTRSRLRMQEESGTLKVEVDRIQHGFEESTKSVFIKLASAENAKNFQVEYTIHASNLPMATSGVINVLIKK